MKIDLGCGSNKRGEDWIGADQYAMPGVDVVVNLGTDRWPWDDDSVDEAYCSHFLEHLTNQGGKWERVHFFNELHRVLKPDAGCMLIIPHWASTRYYGDPTHCEPFSEMGFYYLSREWRASNAPHSDVQWNPHGYDCHLECTWGYNLHADVAIRAPAYQQFAVAWFKEAAQDICATVVKRVKVVP